MTRSGVVKRSRARLSKLLSNDMSAQNTDREIWRETEGDYYSPSIHVTPGHGIGMNVGGYVIVMPIDKWHALAMQAFGPIPDATLKEPQK